MTKKSLFSTKTIVATGVGAALFMVLFMYVKVPSPIPETNLQIAYGVSAFLGALFGPVCGFLVAFIGHALNDLSYGSLWWSWIIASGVASGIGGIAFYLIDLEKGEFGLKEIIKFCTVNIIGNAIAWILVAPILDIVIYSEPINVVFAQGFLAFALDSLCSCVVGGFLASAYAATRTKKGSLS